MDWLYWSVFVVLILWIMIQARNKSCYCKNILDDLTKKSHLEQELDLATTDQLMTEIAERHDGFIMIFSPLIGHDEEANVKIFVQGMNQENVSAILGKLVQAIDENKV